MAVMQNPMGHVPHASTEAVVVSVKPMDANIAALMIAAQELTQLSNLASTICGRLGCDNGVIETATNVGAKEPHADTVLWRFKQANDRLQYELGLLRASLNAIEETL